MPAIDTYPLLQPFNVRDFGAEGDGSADDTAAIQLAIDTAEAAGVSSYGYGGQVFFPTGKYNTTAPLRLPRTTSNPTGVVHLVGENRRTTQIVGTGTAGWNATTSGGVVMWDATTATTWEQRIANLTIVAPSVVGTRCIYHRVNGSTTTLAGVQAEWFQGDFENLLLIGSNQYHSNLIDLEIGNRYGSFRNVFGDPVRQFSGDATAITYTTRLLQVAHQWNSADPAKGEDSVGLGFCTVQNLHSMIRQGGYVALFKGRVYGGTWDVSFDNGARAGSGAYGYDFRNCWAFNPRSLSAEGSGGARQVSFYKSFDCNGKGFNIPIGSPSTSDVAWVANTAYALGARVVPTLLYNPTAAAPRNRVYTCTTAGTSHATTEPTWADSGTTVDNTVVWTASTEVAAADGVVMESCENVVVEGRYASDASSPASYRLTKAVNIDDSCKACHVRDWTLRVVVSGGVNSSNTDAASEVTLSATAKAAYNSISGRAVQAFGSWNSPFALGNTEPGVLSGSATYDPASLNDGVGATTTVTVTGALLGDYVEAVSFSNDLQGITLTGWVSTTNTVSVRFQNESGGTIDLVSGTIRARVRKAS